MEPTTPYAPRTRGNPAPGEHYVYALYGRLPGVPVEIDTVCLYVGVSSNVTRRLSAHTRKWWWPLVDLDLNELQQCATRAEAEALERDEIRWRQPKVNISERIDAVAMSGVRA